MLGLVLVALHGCGGEDGIPLGTDPNASPVCDLDARYLADGGVGRDGTAFPPSPIPSSFRPNPGRTPSRTSGPPIG